LAVESWVAIQFFEINLLQVGSFTLSLQKLLSLAVFPVALILMRRWRIPGVLLALALVMVAANSAWYLARGAWYDSRMVTANVSSLLVAFGATVLYTGFAALPDGLARLGRAWVRWALVTAPVCVAQSLGVLPLFNVPPDQLLNRATTIGLERAVGFKADPNFQALMLVVAALSLVIFAPKGGKRSLQLAIIAVGILATLSRMGMLLFVGALCVGPLVRAARTGRLVPTVLRLTGGGLVAVTALVWAAAKGLLPGSLQGFLVERFVDAWRVFVSLSSGQGGALGIGGQVTSGVARAVLALASFRIFLGNPVVGIGAGRSKDLLSAVSGQFNVAHNTYLEMAMMGGAIGVAFMVIYFVPLAGLWRRRRTSFHSEQAWDRTWGYAMALYLVFAFVFLFLSLNTNSILYVPIAVALATRGRRSVANEPVSARA